MAHIKRESHWYINLAAPLYGLGMALSGSQAVSDLGHGYLSWAAFWGFATLSFLVWLISSEVLSVRQQTK